jgi:hypothetical protein
LYFNKIYAFMSVSVISLKITGGLNRLPQIKPVFYVVPF